MAHCIDSMLEDFEEQIGIHKQTIAQGKKTTTFLYLRISLISIWHVFAKGKDSVRLTMTFFATSYLTLDCLNKNKEALMKIFLSDEWKTTRIAKTTDGKFIANVVLDREFYRKVVICLRGTFSVLQVFRLIDSEEKPTMGFIYEEMDQAKKKIQTAFNGVKESYNIFD